MSAEQILECCDGSDSAAVTLALMNLRKKLGDAGFRRASDDARALIDQRRRSLNAIVEAKHRECERIRENAAAVRAQLEQQEQAIANELAALQSRMQREADGPALRLQTFEREHP